jgi:hypothetical protein
MRYHLSDCYLVVFLQLHRFASAGNEDRSRTSRNRVCVTIHVPRKIAPLEKVLLNYARQTLILMDKSMRCGGNAIPTAIPSRTVDLRARN